MQPEKLSYKVVIQPLTESGGHLLNIFGSDGKRLQSGISLEVAKYYLQAPCAVLQTAKDRAVSEEEMQADFSELLKRTVTFTIQVEPAQ